MKHSRWRAILARLPLPMLALAASYGVFSFALLYAPLWVAIVQAAAFEVTYIGLAVTIGLSADERKRATAISVGAVVVSIVYNTLAGLFHRNPEWLHTLPWYGEIIGAFLHGAPLALVAFLVADLLLHTRSDRQLPAETPLDAAPTLVAARPADIPPQPVYPAPVEVREMPAQVILETTGARRFYCPNCSNELTLGQYGAAKRHGHCQVCKEASK